jgi:hypothetical protein
VLDNWNLGVAFILSNRPPNPKFPVLDPQPHPVGATEPAGLEIAIKIQKFA